MQQLKIKISELTWNRDFKLKFLKFVFDLMKKNGKVLHAYCKRKILF